MQRLPPRQVTARYAGTRQHGFTLVELLVALMVMSLLAFMAWRGLDAMSRSTTHTQARSDELKALQNGVDQWIDDLDAMVDAAALPGGNQGQANSANNANAANIANASRPAPIDWDGRVLRMVRFATGAQSTGLRVVAWSRRVDQGRAQWLRWQSDLVRRPEDLQAVWAQAALWAQNPDDAARAREVAITPLAEWTVYYWRNDAWSNPQSSADAANAQPDGVRMVLTLPEGAPLVGAITRDWMRATLAGNKS